MDMVRNSYKNVKNMAIEPCDEYRAISELSNPYSYSFGKINRDHMHTDDFMFMHNKVNMDYMFRK